MLEARAGAHRVDDIALELRELLRDCFECRLERVEAFFDSGELRRGDRGHAVGRGTLLFVGDGLRAESGLKVRAALGLIMSRALGVVLGDCGTERRVGLHNPAAACMDQFRTISCSPSYSFLSKIMTRPSANRTTTAHAGF